MKIKKDEFLYDYEHMHIDKVCQKYNGVSRSTILRLVRKYRIPKKQGRPTKLTIID